MKQKLPKAEGKDPTTIQTLIFDKKRFTITSKANMKKTNFKTQNTKPRWLTVVNEADAEAAEMTISGSVGESWYDDSGVTAKEFTDELSKIPEGRKITLKINSPGGSIMDGMEIYHALAERADDVTAHIVGYAMSIASVIPLAAGKVISKKPSVWMIHDPLLLTQGNIAEHQKAINFLEANAQEMAEIYAAKTGMSVDEMREMMKAETYFTSSEAVEIGLADDLEDEEDDTNENDGEEPDENEPDTEAEAALMIQAVASFTKWKRIQAHKFSNHLKMEGTTQAGHAASEKSQVKLTMNKTEMTVAAATPPANDDESFKTRFLEERKSRITAEINRRAEGRVKNENLDFWVQSALAAQTNEAEQRVYAQLESMPVAGAPGAKALPASDEVIPQALCTEGRIEVVSNSQDCPFMYSRRTPVGGGIKRVLSNTSNAPVKFARLPGIQAIYDKIDNPKDRVALMRRDWTSLMDYAIKKDMAENGRLGLPIAANTYSSTLATDFLVDQAMTILVGTFAPLSAFTRDFTMDRYKSLATHQVKFATAGSNTNAPQTVARGSIGNYETTSDSVVEPVSVTMLHYFQPFKVTQDELMVGLRLENIAVINLLALANGIISAALQPIATGAVNSSGSAGTAYSAGTYYASAAAGTFGWNTDMPRLRGYLRRSPIKNAILDGAFFSFLANQPVFYQAAMNTSRDYAVKFGGWNEVMENTTWPSVTGNNGATLAGFVCNPQAVAAAAGLPQTFPDIPGNTLQETTVMLPGPDISIALYTWFSLATRALFNSYDLVFGAAGGDASAGAILFNGAGPRT